MQELSTHHVVNSYPTAQKVNPVFLTQVPYVPLITDDINNNINLVLHQVAM